MSRKSKICALALALVFATPITAQAALPANTIIVGNSAYNINYLKNNISRINGSLNGGGSIYYTNTGYTADPVTGAPSLNGITSLIGGVTTISEANIMGTAGSNITYYDSSGTKTKYVYDSGTAQYKVNASSITINTTSTVLVDHSFGIVTVKIDSAGIANVPSAEYFQFGSNNQMAKIIPSGGIVAGQDISNYQVTVAVPLNSSNQISGTVTLYDHLKNPIANGDLPTAAPNGPVIAPGVGKAVTVTVTSNYDTRNDRVESSNGNLSGNINNAGLIAGGTSFDSSANKWVPDKWVYYSNLADGGKLYKMKLDGVDNFILSEDNAKYIVVTNEGWIYYSNYSDSGKLYKMKTDGTKRRKVLDQRASYLNISGGYVYFIGTSTTLPSEYSGNLYRVPVTTASDKLAAEQLSTDEIQNLYVDGEQIYFVDKTKESRIYSMNVNGSFKTELTQIGAKMANFTSTGIYFISDTGELWNVSYSGGIPVQNHVYINIEGNSNTATVEDKLTGMNITDNNIYYTSSKDGNKLYKISGLNNETAEKWGNDPVENINIINTGGTTEQVYYTTKGKMYEAKAPSAVDSKGKVIYVKNAIIKPKVDLKISKSDATVLSTQPYEQTGLDGKLIYDYVPDKVTATMSDNSVRQLLINWDYTKDLVFKGTSMTYKGTIVGYGKSVTLTFDNFTEPIKAADIPFIAVSNNAGDNDDTITLTSNNLLPGDTINAYKDANKTTFLGTGTVIGNTVTITLTRPKVLADADIVVYLTRTTKGKKESVAISKSFASVVASSDVLTLQNVTVTNNAHDAVGSKDTIHIANSTLPVPGTETRLYGNETIKVYFYDKSKAQKGALLASAVTQTDGAPILGEQMYSADISLTQTALADNPDPVTTGWLYITTTLDGKSEATTGLEVKINDAIANVKNYRAAADSDPLDTTNTFITPLSHHPTGGVAANYAYYYWDTTLGTTPLPSDMTYGKNVSLNANWKLADAAFKVQATDGQKIYIVETYSKQVISTGTVDAIVNP